MTYAYKLLKITSFINLIVETQKKKPCIEVDNKNKESWRLISSELRKQNENKMLKQKKYKKTRPGVVNPYLIYRDFTSNSEVYISKEVNSTLSGFAHSARSVVLGMHIHIVVYLIRSLCIHYNVTATKPSIL